MVISGAFVSLRYSPGTTPISSTFPEMGARTITLCEGASGFSPSSSRRCTASSEAACESSTPDCACVASFSAASTSLSAAARCWCNSRSRARSAWALTSAERAVRICACAWRHAASAAPASTLSTASSGWPSRTVSPRRAYTSRTRPATGTVSRATRCALASTFPGATTSSIGNSRELTAATRMRPSIGEFAASTTRPCTGACGAVAGTAAVRGAWLHAANVRQTATAQTGRLKPAPRCPTPPLAHSDPSPRRRLAASPCPPACLMDAHPFPIRNPARTGSARTPRAPPDTPAWCR